MLISYLVVIGISALIGLLEIVNTFEAQPVKALGTLWAWLSIVTNSLSGVLILFILTYIINIDVNPLYLALAVGFGFQTFVRTNFVIAKNTLGSSSPKDYSINVGFIYDQLQNFFKRRIEKYLALEKQKLYRNLLQKFPTTEEIKEIAQELIHQHPHFDEDMNKLYDYINSIADNPEFSEDRKRFTLANFIITRADSKYIETLLKEKKEDSRIIEVN